MYTDASRLVYKDGSLYIWGSVDINRESVAELYRYDISTSTWSILEISGDKIQRLNSHGICAYEESLYVLYGYDTNTENFSNQVSRIDLSREDKGWENLYDLSIDMFPGAFGYVCNQNIVYVYSGLSATGYRNELVMIDLKESEQRISVLSKSMNVPTARYGHAMSVYNEKLYIWEVLIKKAMSNTYIV